MKITRKLVFLPLLVFLFPVVSMGETVDRTELVTRDNLYYKKFTDVPFSGTVTGKEQGRLLEGKKIGTWLSFYESGQLHTRSIYWEPNVLDGEFSKYHENGCLQIRMGFVDGEEHGLFSLFFEKNCDVQIVGHYDKGKRIGEWVQLSESGSILIEGSFNEKGQRTGDWFVKNMKGKVEGRVSYKDGTVISEEGREIQLNILKLSLPEL